MDLVSTIGSAALTAVALTACHVLPPPPVLPPHAGTEPDREGSTTAMLVVGVAQAGELFDGGAVGVALRVEHQQTERGTIGFELSGGQGGEASYDSGETVKPWLVGGRAYGRYAPEGTDDAAITAGVGVSVMTTGLVTGTVHAGLAVAHATDHVTPVGALALALAVPLRLGRPYGDPLPRNSFMLGEVDPMGHGATPFKPSRATASTELYVALDVGLLVPIDDTRNRLSLDLGLARGVLHRNTVLALSLADAQSFGGDDHATAP